MPEFNWDAIADLPPLVPARPVVDQAVANVARQAELQRQERQRAARAEQQRRARDAAARREMQAQRERIRDAQANFGDFLLAEAAPAIAAGGMVAAAPVRLEEQLAKPALSDWSRAVAKSRCARLPKEITMELLRKTFDAEVLRLNIAICELEQQNHDLQTTWMKPSTYKTQLEETLKVIGVAKELPENATAFCEFGKQILTKLATEDDRIP